MSFMLHLGHQRWEWQLWTCFYFQSSKSPYLRNLVTWFVCHLQMKLTQFHHSFSIFCLQKADEGPAWLQLEKPDLKYMSAAQVHAHLKEKAKQRLVITLIYLLFSPVSFMVFYMNCLCLLPDRQIWRHFILHHHHHPPPRAKSVDPHPTPHKFSFRVIVAIK